MPDVNPVFAKTYETYLETIQTLDLPLLSQKLGLDPVDDKFSIRLLNTMYYISPLGIHTASGQRAAYDICVMLCRYLIMCPAVDPCATEWVSFRDFKDSGPLRVYFSNDVENKISQTFTGKAAVLQSACLAMGGKPLDMTVQYDVAMQFYGLPRIPVALLFNDQDTEFDAQAKLLFQKSADHYLDAECLAIMGNLFYKTLKT
jgi:hypothetical protein